MQTTFGVVAGSALVIILLMFANKTKVGHVIIYYSLLLLILSILLAEAPIYANIFGNVVAGLKAPKQAVQGGQPGG